MLKIIRHFIYLGKFISSKLVGIVIYQQIY